MKQMQLVSLKLRNFKGIRDFELEADGDNIRIFGDNATGKTTIFDSFIWLLFDKDSQNKKDFDIKTLDEQNNPIHNLEHEVEGTFRIDNRTTTLKKIFTEKWTKKRGSSQSEFTGHTTDYYIDGVPSKKKEYTDFISGIVSENVFKLLTSPSYFNEQVKWEDRRNVLLEVCGDVSDEEVIASNKGLTQLSEILNGRDIEDHRKVIAAKRKEINKELDMIPTRIDEVRRSMPDVSELDEKALENKIKGLKEQKNAKEEELNRIRSGGEITEKQNQLREIEGQLIEIKNEHARANEDVLSYKRQELYKAKEQVDSAQFEIDKRKRQIEDNGQTAAAKFKRADDLRNEWIEVNKREFNNHGETECPACGQSLPEDQVNEAHQKALAEFNRKKSAELERISAEGKQMKTDAEDLQGYIVTLQNEIKAFGEKSDEKQKLVDSIKNEIETAESSTTSIDENTEYQAKLQEIEGVKDQITKLRESVEESASAVKHDINELSQSIDDQERQRALFDQVKRANERIAELEKAEKELAAKYEELEHELYLTEEFTKTKVELLDQKINSKFRYARFKLFEQQINGGITPTCKTLYKGVPYDSGLNNAAKINVGLDIISTLSEHYGFSAPIFIDNSEAVTRLIDVDAQVISLVVSEQDKALRIENQNENVREAV